MSANIRNLVNQRLTQRRVKERAQRIAEIMEANDRQDFREEVYEVVDEEIRVSRMVSHFR